MLSRVVTHGNRAPRDVRSREEDWAQSHWVSLESLANASFPSRRPRKEVLQQRFQLVMKLLEENRKSLVRHDFYLSRFAGYDSPPHTIWQGIKGCYQGAGRHCLSLFWRSNRPVADDTGKIILANEAGGVTWGVFPIFYTLAGGALLLALPVVKLLDLAANDRKKVLLAFKHFAGTIALHPGDRQAREAKFDEVMEQLRRRISKLEGGGPASSPE